MTDALHADKCGQNTPKHTQFTQFICSMAVYWRTSMIVASAKTKKKRGKKNKHLRSLKATKLLWKLPFKLNWFELHRCWSSTQKNSSPFPDNTLSIFIFTPQKESIGGRCDVTTSTTGVERLREHLETWQHLSESSAVNGHTVWEWAFNSLYTYLMVHPEWTCEAL